MLRREQFENATIRNFTLHFISFQLITPLRNLILDLEVEVEFEHLAAAIFLILCPVHALK